jgi:hypothetical protein
MGELRSLRDKQMAINLQLEELTGVLTRVKDILSRLNLAEIENLKKKQKQMEEGREDSWESLQEINSNFNDTYKKIQQIDSELLRLQVEYKKKQIEKSNIGITLRNLGEIWKYQLAEYIYYVLLVEAIRYLLVPEKTRFKEGLKTFIQWDKLEPIAKLITPDNMKKWINDLSKNLQPLLLKLLEEKTDLTKLFTYSDDDKKLIENISLLKGILAPEEQYQFLETKTIKDIKNILDTKMKLLADNRIANNLTGTPPTSPIATLEQPIRLEPKLQEGLFRPEKIKIEDKPWLRVEETKSKLPFEPIGIKEEETKPKLPFGPIGIKGEDKPWLRVEETKSKLPYPIRKRVGEDIYDISKYERPLERPFERPLERPLESKVKDRLPLIVIERTN